MYSINVNSTMVFAMLFSCLENGKIDWLEFSCSENTSGVPYFVITKNYKKYCVEIVLGDEYSLYDYDDYIVGLGLPVNTGNVFELCHFIAKEL